MEMFFFYDIYIYLTVFGLPLTVKNEDLKEYFQETCGEMEFVEIKHDRYTKKSRGFGFVRFKTEDGAREALSGNHEIEGMKLVVKFSEKKVRCFSADNSVPIYRFGP